MSLLQCFHLCWNICVANDIGYIPLVVNTLRSFPHSRLITTRSTRRVPLVEQELLTLPEHLCSPPVFSGVCVSRSLVLRVCFVDRCLSFCIFSFCQCFVCSSKYGLRLLLWYLQTLLAHSFLSSVLQTIVCHFVLFCLVIVLSGLLRITFSDYLLGIFRLFIIVLLTTYRVPVNPLPVPQMDLFHQRNQCLSSTHQ